MCADVGRWELIDSRSLRVHHPFSKPHLRDYSNVMVLDNYQTTRV